MSAETFRRGKLINLVKKYTRMMEEAKKQAEDYAFRAQTAPGSEAERYHLEMRDQYRVKYQTYGVIIVDLRYEFGITADEVGS